eukprot:3937364-Rhodomonas_salina.1
MQGLLFTQRDGEANQNMRGGGWGVRGADRKRGLGAGEKGRRQAGLGFKFRRLKTGRTNRLSIVLRPRCTTSGSVLS